MKTVRLENCLILDEEAGLVERRSCFGKFLLDMLVKSWE